MPRRYSHISEYEKEIIEMIRKGKTLAKNFFSILKTECINRVKLATYEEASLLISEYIFYYNNYRIQSKTKLTPLEKRNQFVA